MLDYAFKPLLQSIKNNHCTQVLVPGVGENVGVQGKKVKSLAGHRDTVWALTVLPDGTVVSGSVDNTLRHWDPKTGQCLNTWRGHTKSVFAVTVLPDGTVVSGSFDTTLRHWDPQTGQCLKTWRVHMNRVNAVTVLPDGTVVSGSDDKTLCHWDPQTGQCFSTWTGHTRSVWAVTVLPDGTVVSGSLDNTLRHWDPQTGQCLNTWRGHTDWVYGVTALPDGTVVSGSGDKTLRHWDPQTGCCLNIWRGHTLYVRAVTVLPDGTVVSGSEDKTLRHWDPQTGQCLDTWRGYGPGVYAVTVLPDGTVVSGSDGGTLRHWPRVGPTLTLAQLDEVLQALSANTSVTTLSIIDAALTDTTVALLAQVLQHHRTLSTLTLERCGLTASTAVPLLKALMASESGVTRLSLEVGEVCLQADSREAVQQVVGDFLAKVAPDVLLTTLSPALQQAIEELADNQDMTTLAWLDKPLDEVSFQALCEGLSNNTTLKELRLEGIALQEEEAQRLGKVLAQHPRIERLVLDDNPLGEAGVGFILALYESHGTLRKVSLADTGATRSQRQELKQLNKTRKAQRKQAEVAVSTGVDLPLDWVERYRDGLSKEQHFMAEPVVATNDGHTYERETLLNYLGYRVVLTNYFDKKGLEEDLNHPLASRWHLLYDSAEGCWYYSALDVSGEAVQGKLEVHEGLNTLINHPVLVGYVAGGSHQSVLLKGLGEDDSLRVSLPHQKSTLFQAPEVEKVTRLLGESLGYHRWLQCPTHYEESPYSRASLMNTSLVDNQEVKNQIAQYLEGHPEWWHDEEEGVYLPEGWQWGVLSAIIRGDQEVLDRYWSRHPGLVTRRYVHRQGEHLAKALIEGGCLEHFVGWLRRYDGYSQYRCVLPLQRVLSTVDATGGHVLHHLIAYERDTAWYEALQPYCGWQGDYYHGLVHWHEKATSEKDQAAVKRLLARGLLPEGVDDKGRTALMLSIAQGKYAIATSLMSHSPLDVVDKSGDTVLHYLVQQAKSDERDGLIVRLLSEGVDEEATNDKQHTAESILEEKEPDHYRVLMRRVLCQQRQQLRCLEAQLTALKATEVEREKQLRDVLNDEEVQKQLCSPKNVSLRRLFVASNPALASIDKEAQGFLVPKKT